MLNGPISLFIIVHHLLVTTEVKRQNKETSPNSKETASQVLSARHSDWPLRGTLRTCLFRHPWPAHPQPPSIAGTEQGLMDCIPCLTLDCSFSSSQV